MPYTLVPSDIKNISAEVPKYDAIAKARDKEITIEIE
jgi:hypothetical protein